MDLNKFAKTVTLKEGKKINLSIAQVKEVIAIVFKELATLSNEEIIKTVDRYRRNF